MAIASVCHWKNLTRRDILKIYLSKVVIVLRKKPLLWANIVLLAGAMACLVYYDIAGGLWLKGVTSSWFVVLGALNLWSVRKEKQKFPLLMVLGLFCGMCADVLLGVAFYLGVVVFALGHILYLAAFYSLEGFHIRDLRFMIPLAAVSIFMVVGTPWIRVEDPTMKILLLAYALIISAMLGKALSNVRCRPSVFRWLLAVGSVLFWFSDMMLAIDLFGQPSRLVWILCSYSYWPAQNLLAHALYHTKETTKTEAL